jgi:hypothetical protein
LHARLFLPAGILLQAGICGRMQAIRLVLRAKILRRSATLHRKRKKLRK